MVTSARQLTAELGIALATHLSQLGTTLTTPIMPLARPGLPGHVLAQWNLHRLSC